MKIVRRIFWGVILGILVVGGISFMIQTIKNEALTAVMHTTKGDYNFTWELWEVSISDAYPDMLTIYYYVYDEDGNKHTMGYDEFSNMISIGIYADEESLFFE